MATSSINFNNINNVSDQVSDINYPQFGEAIGDPYSVSLKKLAGQIALFGVSALAPVGMGALCANLPMGIAISGIALTQLAIYMAAKEIFNRYNDHRYRLSFEPAANEVNAPKLGTYTPTDLRISNHATESSEWKKALITSARHSIELSPNFAGGEKFEEVLQLIENQMRQFPDLKCHIIVSSDLLVENDKEKLNFLKSTYPNFNHLITDRIYTTTPKLLSEENHVKMLIVDGQYFAMGGTGIHDKMAREIVSNDDVNDSSLGSKFIDKAFRDTDIIGYGEIGETMRNQFFNLYRIWEHRMTGKSSDRFFPSMPEKNKTCSIFHEEEGLITNAKMKYIVGGPEHRKNNPISAEISTLIDHSEKEVRIANLLFNPDKKICKALKKAKEKKIDITGYFNGTGKDSSSAHYLYALPNRYNYHLITKAFEYNKKDLLYHKKLMTVDSRFTLVGSYNFGVKSAICDYENICVIDDTRVAAIMNEALDEDKTNSDKFKAQSLTDKWKWSQIPGKLAIASLGTLFG
ncbi:MAG: phosphatidylserine/phosphatidylglycerophosphate/cardiolipin synthase family protein [Candidatus Protochlamydia sp.]|nr:phosphatidylserine/phosphatidylglycerophosphate/cardiolipin synthase family protein [Candidatus Protochlamydia sp.]